MLPNGSSLTGHIFCASASARSSGDNFAILVSIAFAFSASISALETGGGAYFEPQPTTAPTINNAAPKQN
jgi:hypothetical protein